MPTKRTVLERRRHPSFTPEVIKHFVQLERMPQGSRKFRDGSLELARLLGLTAEWWGMNHVNDRSSGPCHPPWCVSHGDWFRIREVRHRLLAAARELKGAPAS